MKSVRFDKICDCCSCISSTLAKKENFTLEGEFDKLKFHSMFWFHQIYISHGFDVRDKISVNVQTCHKEQCPSMRIQFFLCEKSLVKLTFTINEHYVSLSDTMS